jgi:hypothetical protein
LTRGQPAAAAAAPIAAYAHDPTPPGRIAGKSEHYTPSLNQVTIAIVINH